jgi:heme exporter protein A
LYDQLTALENLKFYASQLGLDVSEERLKNILQQIGLGNRGNDYVGGFSSGMKQRMKYAVLYLKDFPIYLLDEPTSNFDDAGRELFLKFLNEHANSIIVIASNSKSEVELGDKFVKLS